MSRRPLYWAVLAALTATGFAIAVMPEARAAAVSHAAAAPDAGYPGSPSTDTQPPTTPTNVAASYRCDSTQGVLLTLNWTAPTDNVGVTGYDIYATRGVSSSSFEFVAGTTTNSYTQGVALGYFEVRARDAAGNTSDLSTPILVAPPPSPCPTVPASPTPHGTCTAAYSLGASWPGGFQGQVTVTLTFANGQTISQIWGASTVSTGSPYTIGSLAYTECSPRAHPPRSASSVAGTARQRPPR